MEITMKWEGLNEFIKKLDNLQKQQLPRIVEKTLNATAELVKKGEIDIMKSIFDRPTPYTLGSLYIWRADTRRLVAEVTFKDQAKKYIAPHVYGGSREMKRSERRLNRYWVPGAKARLNQYGNISAGQITQILSVLKRSADPYQNITSHSKVKNRKPRDYFAIYNPGRNLQPGVYERYGVRKIRPILIFINDPTYKKRFPFYEVGKQIVEKNIKRLFDENFNQTFNAAR